MFEYPMRIVCGIIFSRESLVAQSDKAWGKGAMGDPAPVSKLWEEPPGASRPGRCPSVRWAPGQSSGVQAPAPPAGRVPPPGLEFRRRPLPVSCRSAAQLRPDPFQNTEAAAKDRRTSHHRLKIRPEPRRGHWVAGGRFWVRGDRTEVRADWREDWRG